MQNTFQNRQRTGNIADAIAAVIVLSTLICIPIAMLSYESSRYQASSGRRIIEITGIAETGTWTLKNIVGHNYWREEFPKANVVVAKGEDVILRIRSSDVTHGFAIPALAIGPVEVESGKYKDVPFRADKSGRYLFACYTVCGKGHNQMTGTIEVVENREPQGPLKLARLAEDGPPELANGRAAVNRLQCLGCHTIEKAGEKVAPDLDRSLRRLRLNWVGNFLSDSERPKIRTHQSFMPDMKLEPEDVKKLVTYFAALMKRPTPEPPVLEPALSPESVRRGRELVQKYGCFGCHRFGDVQFEGRSPDFLPEVEMVQVRFEAPCMPLASKRLDPEWTVEFILNPKKFLADTRMPRLVLSRVEAEAIRDFIWSLGR